MTAAKEYREQMRAKYEHSLDRFIECFEDLMKAESRNAELNEQLDVANASALNLHNEAVKYKRANAELVEALCFYADPDTYFATTLLCDNPCGDIANDYSEDHGGDYDRPMLGKTARSAVKQYIDADVAAKSRGAA